MYKKDLETAGGMWGIWNYDTYKHIDDYDKWDELFCEDEDIMKQIENHSFVPVNICQDGCCAFTVKIDEEISERETKYICVQSEEYLFRSSSKVVVSGIDKIDSGIDQDEGLIIDIPEGYYSVKVYLLSWDEEPGAYLENGEISPNALSDFVLVLKSNVDENGTYRNRVNTFSEDD